VTNSTTIDGTTEIETEVTDLRAMAEILSRLGLAEVRYQENYREEWRWGEIAFDLDTWPGLPTFVEIEVATADAFLTRFRARSNEPKRSRAGSPHTGDPACPALTW
jgi:adenylate cyclase class IV